MNKWNTPYKNLVVPEPYGDTITYRLGSDLASQLFNS